MNFGDALRNDVNSRKKVTFSTTNRLRGLFDMIHCQRSGSASYATHNMTRPPLRTQCRGYTRWTLTMKCLVEH